MLKTSGRSRLKVAPLDTTVSLRALAYDALKRAITDMDIYGRSHDIRLDERQLSQDLGVSRTPIREALTVLEQEGFVRSVPRRGIFVLRKIQGRNHRADLRLGRPREHGGPARHRACERRRLGRAAPRLLRVRDRRPGRAPARILRGEYRLSPDDHPARRLPVDPGDDREPVPPHEGDPGRLCPPEQQGGAVARGSCAHHLGSSAARCPWSRSGGPRPHARARRPCRSATASSTPDRSAGPPRPRPAMGSSGSSGSGRYSAAIFPG